MKPVDQTTFGGPDTPPAERGDCLSAALASILEVPLEAVPRFCEHGSDVDWSPHINEFLAGFDLMYFGLEFDEDDPGHTQNLLDAMGYHVITGPGPRSGVRHSVVGYQGEVVHDPHPSRDGLAPDAALGYGVLVARLADPGRIEGLGRHLARRIGPLGRMGPSNWPPCACPCGCRVPVPFKGILCSICLDCPCA